MPDLRSFFGRGLGVAGLAQKRSAPAYPPGVGREAKRPEVLDLCSDDDCDSAGTGARPQGAHPPQQEVPALSLAPEQPRMHLAWKDPAKIVTWNANGLVPRVSSPRDLGELVAFLRHHSPDVVCLQEARLKARCSNPKAKVSSGDMRDRSRPLDSELDGPLRKALSTPPLSEYVAHWSLANGRAAGTGMLVHRRLGCIDGAAPACSAESALAQQAGGAAPLGAAAHNPEGRLQYASFATFDLLNTYVPNNGWTDERHAVRKKWDADLAAFLAKRRGSGRPLVWCGDMNVAHKTADSTDEDFFRAEWDRDGKRYSSREAYDRAIPAADRGIPGFSDNERQQFDGLLAAGGLADVWRLLHPAPPGSVPAPDPEAAAYTWRGSPAVQSTFKARYEGKAQRLDYFLLSESLVPKVASCEIGGHGASRHGFLGSDHCPVILSMSGVADLSPSP